MAVGGLALSPLSVQASSAAINDIKSGLSPIDPGSPTVDSGITAFINILSTLVGIAAIVMVLYGSFKYITSAGDANSVKSARNTIVYALLGLAIALLTQVIIRVVIVKALK